jgi:hypothetical protein
MTDFIPKTQTMSSGGKSQMQNLPRTQTEGYVEVIKTPEILPPSITGSQVTKKDPKVQAAIKLGQVTTDQRVLNLLRAGALWKQTIQTVKGIENEAAYSNAIDTFTKIKAAIKEAGDIKGEYIDFPNEFVKLVRNMFRPLEKNLQESKAHMGRLIENWDAALREEQRKREEEARLKQAEIPEIPEMTVPESEGDIIKVEDSIPAPPEKVPTVQKTERGGKVQMRDSLEVEVTSITKLLKAITSTAAGNVKYTEELVEVRVPQLKALIKANPKLKKIPGVKFEWKKIAV